MNTSNIIEILTEAKKSLTDETWIKKALFGDNGNGPCFCAHGAVQFLTNPAVREFFSDREDYTWIFDAKNVGLDATPIQASKEGERAVKRCPLPDFQNVWDWRPSWLNENNENYGSRDYHFLLGMVGLTADFNDDSSTTLPMIHEKLDQAIKLALTLGI